MKIELDNNPTPEDIKRVHDGLYRYNLEHTIGDTWRPLAVFVRDDEGNIQGGLTGGTFWHWCHVDIVWLDASIRRGGYGSQLLRLAEEAIRRGCIGIFVDTMSFQAPEFYAKQGYEEWGRLEDIPRGHQRIFFRKRFDKK